MAKDICYKCGCELNKNNRSREHVPPRCLVTEENKSKLIIVPSCKKCNIGDSKDIEYFRNWIITFSAKHNKEAWEIYNNKVKKSWAYRPSIKIGMRNMINDEEITTPGGIFLGKQKFATGEYDRVNPILESISRAIIFHHFSKRDIKLPYGVKPFIIDDFNWGNQIIKPFIDFLLQIPILENLVPDVFNYKFGQLGMEDGFIFYTFLNFYNRKLFCIWYLMEK